jgi:type IV secretory pathway VirJ component
MNKIFPLLAVLFLAVALPSTAATKTKTSKHSKAAPAAVAPAAAPGDTLKYGRFGTVTLYRTSPHPKHVVLFLSGDGGWNLGVVDMARTLASLGSLVVGIDFPYFEKKMEATKEACHYPASDLELLSKYVQKKLDYPNYVTPVVVGYSSGATMAYAVAVQAPSNTFDGAISMGFCPDLPLKTPMCKGQGLAWGPGPKGKGVSFLPATNLEVPWVAFQGLSDQVCFPADVEKYVKQVKGAEIVTLPKVGHGFSKPQNWEPQFRQAFTKIVADDAKPAAAPAAPGAPKAAAAPPAPKELGNLPVIEVPAKGQGDTLALFVSGDGGWAQLDRSVSDVLAAKGVPVVGLNSLKYFWSAHTPESTAADVARILRYYLAAWKKEKVILVGYSFGADVLPPVANRLPADLLERVKLLALIGPSHTATFEFHVGDWLGIGGDKGLPIAAEVKKLQGKRFVCLYGEDEGKESLCPAIDPQPGVKGVVLPGSHHFGGRYDLLADPILKEAE